MATIKENMNQLVKTNEELREVIDLCCGGLSANEGMVDYPSKIVRAILDEPTPEVIGVAPRVTAGGRMISDPISSVRKIYGETRKWNQKIGSVSSFKGYAGGIASFDGDVVLSDCSQGNGAYVGANFPNLPIESGRIYLVSASIKYIGQEDTKMGVTVGASSYGLSSNVDVSSEWTRICKVASAKNSGSVPYIVYALNARSGTLFARYNLLVDLTSIYGSGKEPTTEDAFCQDYFGKNAADVTDEEWAMLSNYQEPTLVNSSPKSIVSKPTTLWWNQCVSIGESTAKAYTDIIDSRTFKVNRVDEWGNGIVLADNILNVGDTYMIVLPKMEYYEENVATHGTIQIKTGPYNTYNSNGCTVHKRINNSPAFDYCVFEATDNYLALRLFRRSGYSGTDEYVIFKNVCCFNLTKMFNGENMPTTADELTQRILGKDAADVTDDEWYMLSEFCDGEERIERGLGEAWESTLEIDPKSIRDAEGNQVFPYGWLSAGDVRDEIDWERGVAIKRIGVFEDLSKANFRKGNSWYITDLQGVIKIQPISTSPGNLLSVMFTAEDWNHVYYPSNSFNYNTIAVNSSSGNVAINGDGMNYLGLEELKNKVSGVRLQYELAEPIEYPLPATWRKSWMRVANGGTERITADGMTLPLHVDIAYRTANAAALANDLSNANNIL